MSWQSLQPADPATRDMPTPRMRAHPHLRSRIRYHTAAAMHLRAPTSAHAPHQSGMVAAVTNLHVFCVRVFINPPTLLVTCLVCVCACVCRALAKDCIAHLPSLHTLSDRACMARARTIVSHALRLVVVRVLVDPLLARLRFCWKFPTLSSGLEFRTFLLSGTGNMDSP